MDLWPKEVVGAFVCLPGGCMRYLRLDNVHSDPINYFAVSKADVQMLLSTYGAVHGVHHSHTKCSMTKGTGLYPSAHDMQTQLNWGIPFYITCLGTQANYVDFFGWGDQLPPPPLKQRDFRSGVSDCYALVRHFHYAHTGVVLPDGPRTHEWWADPEAINPIVTSLTSAGFVAVDPVDISPGDFITFAITKGIVCHCGVYVGGDLFLHHLYGRLSKVDPLPQWRRFPQQVVRYAPGAIT